MKYFCQLESLRSRTFLSVVIDRYIMFGNHRDGWTYGASDPSSGTAAMMEIVRVLGKYKKQGRNLESIDPPTIWHENQTNEKW